MKQTFANDVQIALDNGVETYYANITKDDVFTFFRDKNSEKSEKGIDNFVADVLPPGKTGDTAPKKKIRLNSLDPDKISSVTVYKDRKQDSVKNLKNLTASIVVSITRDSLLFDDFNKALSRELERKDLDIDYNIVHFKSDTVYKKYELSPDSDLSMATFSKSTYLPKGDQIELQYSNPVLLILKRGTTGVLLSFILCLCIISCLLYLLYIIKKQKQLAEIKNDLISNITHELKTPIATATTAIEGVTNFNPENDFNKNMRYLNVSKEQLGKLSLMVEKILETATLDSDKLLLNKKKVNIDGLVQKCFEKYQILETGRTLEFHSDIKNVMSDVDVFHLENAVCNLIDNAIKYGGDTIEISMKQQNQIASICIADNGNVIPKSQQQKIFDKFYRIPTGNRHDIKGFGIGLYYTKKIIEKHNGTLALERIHDKNTFIINLPILQTS
ncbi:sensor histidine kinase [Sinomicrobium weinanense]|uniref:histidine kinase n=1 Tax=Sinomicrobium weinanense TaxID=2842200 RepID=A0A926JRF9_9FLAO|nr:HAMP domain-containing sensor histidine kinase [Sinomicrobium weinanense]MBC9796130.1 HAMP domain-containing histidine kinase [Sinomicrobium weinanense]MBU3121881.1 HAMP domain-containing histidine kinase [Sinomicrobium weinanense]